MQQPDMQSGPTPDALRHAFLGWQCRIRQIAVRQQGGRPSAGMRPLLEIDGEAFGPITVVLTRTDKATIRELRFMARRTRDPRERYQAAIRYFAATYYQHPEQFSDHLMASFAADAALPRQIAGRDDCILLFEQFGQRFRLVTGARLLDPEVAEFQATYWHNALFNAAMPGAVQIVAFIPDWTRAEADPPPPAEAR